MSDILKKLTKEMQKVQDPKRFTHTLGVEYTAAALAMRYSEDVERAQIAGLLHDCAKCMENDKLLSVCEKYHLPATDVETRNPYLLHARVGSYLAKKEYKIEDPEILSAILYHTTGRPGMTLLEKIIFTADYIEPGRKQAPNLTQIRHLAFTDLDAAVTKILEDTLEYLKSGVVDYEFRTTVVKELHKREDIEAIGQWLSGSRRYFLQNYKESEQVIRPVFTSYSREQLENFQQILQKTIPQVEIRGI